ncbi:MAG: hypothetical protein ACE3L7_33595 [Candidatus Pristimantibacillus sp.]
MTRQEVINAFPKDRSYDDIAYIIMITISFLFISYSILRLVMSQNYKKKRILNWSILFIAGGLFLFSITQVIQMNNYNESYPELKQAWKHESFLPYLQSLDEIKVPIFQSKWNNEGKLDLILDTDKYKKTLTGIQNFDFYDSFNPDDKGYVLIKDLGNLDDFPVSSDVKYYYTSILHVGTWLPKRDLEVK